MKKTEIVKSMNGFLSKTSFQLKKHSPEILVVAGVIGVVTSAVMACKATTKVGEILDKTKEDVIATYQQAITNTLASWKQQCGDDVTVSFAIKGMSEQSQDFLTEWTDDMNEMIGEDKVHAQNAVTLSVERTLTGSKGTQTETISPTLIQVDGFWYILQENTTAADSQQATE